MTKLNLIVAVSENGIIGYKNTIPWYLPEDLKQFKSMTMNSVIIMGRNTWESLPKKPLPGRINIVISKTIKSLSGVDVYTSLEYAVSEACKAFPEKPIFCIGGETLYKEALDKNLVDRIYYTTVNKTVEGDTSFYSKDELISKGFTIRRLIKTNEEFETVMLDK